MEEKNNQKEELEREIEKLKEQVELERLRKERDELREKIMVNIVILLQIVFKVTTGKMMIQKKTTGK